MNIGILLISDGYAGAENAVKYLAENLSKSNKVFLFTNDEIKKYFTLNNSLHVSSIGEFFNKSTLSKIIYLPILRKKLKDQLALSKLDILVIFLETSLVFHYMNNPKGLIFMPALRGSEIVKYINNESGLFNKINKICLNYSFKKSSKITSVSHNQIQNLQEKYKKKTIVIPNGVDSDKFKPLKNIKQKRNVVLFVGRIIKDKGINEILSVAKKLPQYEFWFAGKGDLSKEINLLNTKYLGEKNSDELVKLYNQATICILPSYHEGFSNVGLETIACGRSLICTPDFSEYIENGKDGIIIPAKDEKALKDAIIDLMTNEKKRKMIEKNARKKVLQYSWDNVAKQYMKVFREVLKESEKKK